MDPAVTSVLNALDVNVNYVLRLVSGVVILM